MGSRISVDAARQRRGRPAKSGVPPLDREQVIQAAVEMTSREQSQPLTFRALGRHLGVDPAALYRYVSSKDELLLAVADGIIGKAVKGFVQTGSWREDLAELLSRLHFGYLGHPEVAVAAAARITRLPGEMRFAEIALGLLKEAGLADPEAAVMYRAVADTVLAWTGFRAGLELNAAAESDHKAWEEACLEADPVHFPNVARLASPLTAVTLQQGFRQTLDLLLTAVQSRAEETA